jgi:hypothetical protein
MASENPPNTKCAPRARSSAAERAAHNRLVDGSNPSGPTKADVAVFIVDYRHLWQNNFSIAIQFLGFRAVGFGL